MVGYCAFIGAVGVSSVPEGAEGEVLEGLKGVFSGVLERDDLLEGRGTRKAPIR